MTDQPCRAAARLAWKGTPIDGRVDLATGVRQARQLYRPTDTTLTAPDQDCRVRLGSRQPIHPGKRVCS
jgi:hypothetical protein